MKIRNIVRRTNTAVLTLVLAFSTMLSILVPGIAHAAGPYTCTWTGGGSDSKFSTAANWAGCNSGAAPVAGDGDNLVFDNTSVSNFTPVNDLTSATFSSITFQGSGTDSFELGGNAFTLTGGMTNSSGQVDDITNDITLSGNQSIDPETGDIVIDGNISGSGNLTVDSTSDAILFLSGDNSTYSGNIVVSTGELWAESTNALGNAVGTTTVDSGAILNFLLESNGTVAEPLNLAGDGQGAGFENFALGSVVNDINLTLSGNIVLAADTTVGPGNARGDQMILTGGLSGAHTISVAEAQYGSLVIQPSSDTSNTAAGTYVAPVVTHTLSDNDNIPVSIGFNVTYVIDGTESSVDVGDGGTLKGTGTVADTTVETGGTIAPGHSPGCLNTGDLTLRGTYQAEIGGTTACSGYDQLNVTGTVDVTGATLATSLYNGFKPAAGQTYTIINNDGADAVTGTFSGLAEGTTFTVNGYVFQISYKGGSGNDVVLSVKSVPAAPNTGFALLSANPLLTLVGTTVAAAGILVIAQRNRRATAKARS